VGRRPEPHALEGTTLADRYRLDSLLHAGRHNDLFAATDLDDSRSIVVKVPRDTSNEAAETLAREAAFLGEVRHPNLPEVFDVGADDDRAYLVMEALAGETLAEWVERSGPLPELDVLAVFWQVLSALQALHESGVVHRDLRPRNVFLVHRAARPPRVKILDFASAKFVRNHPDAELEPRYAAGAHRYMAPEQHRGEIAGPWVDIYSVGAMLHAALAGELPVPGFTLRDRRLVSPALDALVMKAIADEPTARFESAAALQDVLTRTLLVGE